MPAPITDPIDEFDDIDIAMPTLPSADQPRARGLTSEQERQVSEALRDIDAVTPLTEVLDAEPARPADEQAIAHAAQSLVARAQAFHVTSPETYETAGLIIDELKRQKKAVEGFFAPMVEKAHAAWKALTSKRGSLTDPLDQALVVIQARYADYARKVREEAERERRRLEKEAQEREQARLRAEAEAREKEAEEARQAALQASTREEAQVLEQQAEELQQAAEATRVEAATVQAPVLPTQTPIDTKKGPTVAQNWQHEVTDLEALIKAVASGEASKQALLANDTYLRQRAKADKGSARIPGVRFFDAGSVRASRGRR